MGQRDTHMEVRHSKFGRGVFAWHDLSEGSVLCRISGKEISFLNTLELKEHESHALQIDVDRYILLQPPLVYCNHSCLPNCGINADLEFCTLREVKAGEELFWDYSTSMLERHWTMPCSCGQICCRKHITDFDLLPQRLQSHYVELKIVLPFILQFLQQGFSKTA